MKKFLPSLDRFFFKWVSATGFGMMRSAWGAIVFWSMLTQWPDITRYYGREGMLPRESWHIVFRNDYRFSILDYVTDERILFALYLLLLLAAFCTMLGVRARISTILTCVLLFSFHERNTVILAGGETVLRVLGFLLMIAPGITAFSYDRARLQLKSWTQNKERLPHLQMPIWPYRLLLWQLVILYITSGWDKLMGTMWWNGTAVETVLHLETFTAPWAGSIIPFLSTQTLALSRLTVLYEWTWLFLLIPAGMWKRIGFTAIGVKRVVLFFGVLFHACIAAVLAVGTFPYALFAAYLGLLHEKDHDALRARFNRLRYGKIVVLFDGSCGFCRRSIAWLEMCDWLHRLTPEDFTDPAARKRVASDIDEKELDRAMHVRIAYKKQEWKDAKTLKGFYAFRALTWHLPPFWPVAPFLYIPGVSFIGNKIYRRIAKKRKKCNNKTCMIS